MSLSIGGGLTSSWDNIFASVMLSLVVVLEVRSFSCESLLGVLDITRASLIQGFVVLVLAWTSFDVS